MSLRQRFINLPIVSSFGRRLSGPLDRGWGDTLVGPPLDSTIEGDRRPPAPPAVDPPGKVAKRRSRKK